MADSQAEGRSQFVGRTEFSRVGRIVDYFFGRNSLIGLASLMLLAISGYATWSGMNDFIIGVQSTDAALQGRTIPGGLSVSYEALVIVVVVALTFLMWLALRETFGAQRLVMERLTTFPLYLFLALWSIGFGYGFWWSLIAGEEATRSSLSGLQEDARDAANVVAARLDAVKIQLDGVVAVSEQRMSVEESTGGSCGRSSGAGRGPLYNARRNVRDQVATLRDSIATSWLAPINNDLAQLRQSVARIEGATVAERQEAFEVTARNVRGRARNIAARSNAIGETTAAEMNALADSLSVAPGEPNFTCYDPRLAQSLRQAADQAGEPAVLNLRQAAFTEGPAGVANAVKRLWGNIGSYASSMYRYVASGGEVAEGTTDGGSRITGRDLIALLATLGIDLGLFALTVLNPPQAPPSRYDALQRNQARLHLPNKTVIRQLTAAIETAIARAPGADIEWVRKHLIHHGGTSFFVIPNLFSVETGNKDEELRALAMNQLAGVFDDLELIRTLTQSELRVARREEERDSRSTVSEDEKVRNHGLLSKSRRVLEIAGWSASAQKDLEVYSLVDTEGLTPLLTVLNEAVRAGEESEAELLAQIEDNETPAPQLNPPRGDA